MKKIIKVHPSDNVAIIATKSGINKNSPIEGGVTAKNNIPFNQKIALENLAKNQAIIRYGVPIGYAKESIQQGEWVNENSMYIHKTIPLTREIANQLKYENHYRFKDSPNVQTDTFQGYLNADGTVGTKNILAINVTVQCVKGVVDQAIEQIRKEILPKYPNVDDVVQLNHVYGCGVAIHADNAEIPKRTIRNLADNPNFGNEKLVVALGCEKFIPEDAFQVTAEDSENLVVLQECNGYAEMIDEIIYKAEQILKHLNKRSRQTLPVSNLIIGLQCGGSDAFSGMTANPAIGYAADLFVQQGAKVMFSEVTEVRDAAEILLKRIRTTELRMKLIQELTWYDNYLAHSHVDRAENPSPGNKKGGLSTIIEKAMGSIAKSGTAEIIDVLSPGEKIKKSGMTYAATPASDFVCGTQQLASGMTLEVFSTGRGTPYNLEQCPVIKVATNTKLAEKWADIIDFDAGTILDHKTTLEEAGKELYRLMIAVASGEIKTKAEQHKIYNDLAIFNPAPIT